MFARSPGHRRGFWSSVYTVPCVSMMKTYIIITVNENNLFWDIRIFENASVWDDCHDWWNRKKEASGLLDLCSSDGLSNYTKKELQLTALRSFGNIVRVPTLCILFFLIFFYHLSVLFFRQDMLKLHTLQYWRLPRISHTIAVMSHKVTLMMSKTHLGLMWIASHIQQGHQIQ